MISKTKSGIILIYISTRQKGKSMTIPEKNLDDLLATLKTQGILVRVKANEIETRKKIELRDRDGREICLLIDLERIPVISMPLVRPSIKDEIPQWFATKFTEMGIECTTFGRSSIQFYNLEGLAMEPMRVM